MVGWQTLRFEALCILTLFRPLSAQFSEACARGQIRGKIAVEKQVRKCVKVCVDEHCERPVGIKITSLCFKVRVPFGPTSMTAEQKL